MRLLTLATLALAAGVAQARDITVSVDGKPVTFSGVGPQMMGGRVVVPLRGVFESLGATVDWRESDQSIYATKAPRTIWLRIGDHEAKVDGMPVHLDQPAVIYQGTTMVPLRFVSESLGADVHWNEAMQAVRITTAIEASTAPPVGGNYKELVLDSGTVLPMKLNTALSSNKSQEGDKFTATLDTKGEAFYAGLPKGTTVIGHVSTARPKDGKDPGVLDLAYDSVVLPDGSKYPVHGSLIGLDAKSVETKDGHLVAKNRSDDHKSVWIGAGAGAVLAVLTKGNILTNTVVGAALGYLYERLELGGSNVRDVNLKEGTTFGVRLDQDFVARIDR
jgi:hypothetical protein